MATPNEQRMMVFYSWQSDRPTAVNQKLIRNALNTAANSINADVDNEVHVVVEEATTDVPGSPDIADTILRKIREADVFVCDLTKAAEATNETGEVRKYCNSNVALELGYAVRVLGWDRIIVVFNKAYGKLPDDLPFDASRHRTAVYQCGAELDSKGKPTAGCRTLMTNATGNLAATLIDALNLIARKDPKRPEELDQKTPKQIKRERDVKQLNRVFKYIHTGVMDLFIKAIADGHIRFDGQELYQGLSCVVGSSSFKIADSKLRDLIIEFYTAWTDCFKFAHAMDLHPSGTHAHFRMPGDVEVSAEQGKQFKYTSRQWKPLEEAFRALLDYVHEHYLEIDPTQTGREAVDDYLKSEKETKEMIEKLGRSKAGPRKGRPANRPS